MSNLIEGLLAELRRVRKLKQIYEEIGTSGAFGVAVMESSILNAEGAMASGDIAAMVRALEDLRMRK